MKSIGKKEKNYYLLKNSTTLLTVEKAVLKGFLQKFNMTDERRNGTMA